MALQSAVALIWSQANGMKCLPPCCLAKVCLIYTIGRVAVLTVLMATVLSIKAFTIAETLVQHRLPAVHVAYALWQQGWLTWGLASSSWPRVCRMSPLTVPVKDLRR